MYGFHKTKQDPDCKEFKHPYFKYNRPDLLGYIKRRSNTNMMKLTGPEDDLPTQMAELQDKYDSLEQKLIEQQNTNQYLVNKMRILEQQEQEKANRDIQTRNLLQFLLNNAIERGSVTRSAVLKLLNNPMQDNLITNDYSNVPLIMNQPHESIKSPTMPPQIYPIDNSDVLIFIIIQNLDDPFYNSDFSFSENTSPTYLQPPLQVEEVGSIPHTNDNNNNENDNVNDENDNENENDIDNIPSPYLDYEKGSEL